MKEFLAAFIPLFVALDAFGLVPVFLAMTDRLSVQRRREITFQAVSFALLISLGFMFLGNWIFRFLSITEADFRIAGGLLLLVLAIIDLITFGRVAVHEQETVGLFPLAMPLIAGPATLTTVLVLANNPAYGYSITSLSIVTNFAIVLISLFSANEVTRWIGPNALRAFSKLIMVLLAAIAVNLIRSGVMSAIREMRP